MNDVRLIDDPNDDLADLLRAARDETAISNDAQKALVWNALGSSALTATATGAALKTKALKVVTTKWIAAGIISVSSVVAIVSLRVGGNHQESPARVGLRSASQLPRRTIEPEMVTSNPVMPPHQEPAVVAGIGKVGVPVGASSLQAEASLLALANERLERGDVTGAKKQLEAYGKRFPNGRLSLERDVLAIEARTRLHENVDDSVGAFKRAHPESPHATRLGNEHFDKLAPKP